MLNHSQIFQKFNLILEIVLFFTTTMLAANYLLPTTFASDTIDEEF